MKFVSLIVLVTAEHEEKMKNVAKEAGATGAMVIQAKGTEFEEKKSFFSLTFEGNHTILLYILEAKISKLVLKAIKKEIETEQGDGIAFTMPIDHIVGLNQKVIEKFEEKIKIDEVL